MSVTLQPVVVDMKISTDIVELDMDVSVLSPVVDMDVSTSIAPTTTPAYTGDYIVIPAVHDQILPTNGLRMTDDVTVTEIPYYETSNESGITVFIANNLNND